jgi:hypothetical protein
VANNQDIALGLRGAADIAAAKAIKAAAASNSPLSNGGIRGSNLPVL